MISLLTLKSKIHFLMTSNSHVSGDGISREAPQTINLTRTAPILNFLSLTTSEGVPAQICAPHFLRVKVPKTLKSDSLETAAFPEERQIPLKQVSAGLFSGDGTFNIL